MPDTNYLRGFDKFGSALVAEATRFQEAQNTILANEAILEFQDKARSSFRGADNPDGTRVSGYADLHGIDAVDAHSDYELNVNQTFNDILGNLDPAVKAKALLRMNEVRQTYLNRGAVHRTQQQDFAKKQSNAWAFQEAKKEFELDTERGWEQAKTAMSNADDVRSRLIMEQDFANYAVAKVFDNRKRNGASDEVALSKAKEWFETHRSELTEGVELEIDAKLRKQEKVYAAAAEAKHKEALGKYQAIVEASTGALYTRMLDNPETHIEGLSGQYSHLKQVVYPDDAVKADRIHVNGMKTALKTIAVEQGYAAAAISFNLMKSEAAKKGVDIGDPTMLADVEYYLNSTLQSYSKAQTDAASQQVTSNIIDRIYDAKNPTEIDRLLNEIEGDPNIGGDVLRTVEPIARREQTLFNKTYTDADKDLHDSTYNILYYQMLKAGKMTDAINKQVNKAVADGALDRAGRNKLLEKAIVFDTRSAAEARRQAATEDRIASKKSGRSSKAFKRIESMIRANNLVYDHETGELRPLQVVPGKPNVVSAKDVRHFQRYGLSPTGAREVAIVKEMEKYEQWQQANPDAPLSQFIDEEFVAHPVSWLDQFGKAVLSGFNAVSETVSDINRTAKGALESRKADQIKAALLPNYSERPLYEYNAWYPATENLPEDLIISEPVFEDMVSGMGSSELQYYRNANMLMDDLAVITWMKRYDPDTGRTLSAQAPARKQPSKMPIEQLRILIDAAKNLDGYKTWHKEYLKEIKNR
jgi:hypothetical protein